MMTRGELVPARCPRTGRIKLSVPKRAWKFHQYDGPAGSSITQPKPETSHKQAIPPEAETKIDQSERDEAQQHLQPESPNFNCELCPESYRSWRDLLSHVRECHP